MNTRLEEAKGEIKKIKRDERKEKVIKQRK
jgi:hypothetical protein